MYIHIHVHFVLVCSDQRRKSRKTHSTLRLITYIIWCIIVKMANEMDIAFEKSILEFSLQLYKALDKGDNAFFSPFSVSAALMLLLLGIDGEAKAELKAALHLQDLPELDPHRGYSQLSKKLISKSGDGILLALANRIFSKADKKLCKDFSYNALMFYDSEVELMDFINKTEESRQTINSWVERKTNDKIKNLIQQGVISRDTAMVIANAIYFKGSWDLKFDKGATTKQPFYLNDKDSVDVDMMFKNTEEAMSGCYEALNCNCLQLQYKQREVSMFVMLPKDRTGLDALEKKLTTVTLLEALKSVRKQETNIYLPKFKLEIAYDLKPMLHKVGINKIFESSADFSAMFEDGGSDAYVSDVVHKAFVEVNEEGTEAAAATAIGVMLLCLVIPFEFRADHPFLFFIIENDSKSVLFMGRYVKPN